MNLGQRGTNKVRLIPFLSFERSELNSPSAVFLLAAMVLGQLWLASAGARAEDFQLDTKPTYDDRRPVNTGEFLKRCRLEPLYCDDQFAAYIQRYAAVRVEELARQEPYRQLRERLRDPNAFEGICLPRERLLTDDFMTELSRRFRGWAEAHVERHAERIPIGVKAAMQTLYPCP